MSSTAKPKFASMTFTELSDWVSRNNKFNGEDIFDSDFSDIEDMYEMGEESEAFDEYESIAHEIWAVMSTQNVIEDPL